MEEKIWLNQFSKWPYFKDRPLEDTDYTEIRESIEKNYGVEFSIASVTEACAYIAKINGKNPLLDWLNGTIWDGVPRMDEWVMRACGVDDTKLAREMGRKWLIQCVARAMEPGCKADCVLILVGPQGAKKSTTFRILASPEYFGDTTMDIGHANAYMQIHRAWIYEVAELDSIRKARNSSVKAFCLLKRTSSDHHMDTTQWSGNAIPRSAEQPTRLSLLLMPLGHDVSGLFMSAR